MAAPDPAHPRLAGVVALVTGATSGLGRAMAEALLGAGATVIVAARPGPRLAEAARAWVDRGWPAHPLALDVRRPASVAAAAATVRRRWPDLLLLVNNAGIGMRTVNPDFLTRPMPFHQVPVARFQDVIATNLTGYFLVARALAPLMVERGRGRIVNVSMNHETMGRAGFVPYGPSRAGAESLSRIMTEDLRPHGVAVNLLLPGGATDTGMIPETLDPAARARLLRHEVMGPPIVFLASPEAEGVTGERIVAARFEDWLAACGKAPDLSPPHGPELR